MILYHYTCKHSIEQIEKDGYLKPHLGLVWATDLFPPVREALGLTSHLLKCDRMEAAYTLDSSNMMRWMDFRKHLPGWYRERLESADGAMPVHWWVSTRKVPVKRLDTYRGLVRG
jgi:hypothetical protein